MKPGRWLLLQVGVKGLPPPPPPPRQEKRRPGRSFLPANTSSVVISLTPSAVGTLNVVAGSLSPTPMVIREAFSEDYVIREALR